MRKAWGRWAGVTIGMCGAAAAPAGARDFPYTVIPVTIAEVPGGATEPMPLASQVPARAPLADNVLLIPPDPARGPGSGVRPQDRYATPHAVSAPHLGMLAAVRRTLRPRGSSMTDVYARGTSGFRLSAGSSYRVDYTAPDYGPSAAAGPAALMRLPIGVVNLRDGYESYAPVALAGYDQPLGDRLKIGVEGGVMRGRAAAISPVESMPTSVPPDRAGINPVGDVVMTYLF